MDGYASLLLTVSPDMASSLCGVLFTATRAVMKALPARMYSRVRCFHGSPLHESSAAWACISSGDAPRALGRGWPGRASNQNNGINNPNENSGAQ